MARNSYYLITLSSKTDLTRLNEFLALGTKSSLALPHQKLHYRIINDTKVIIQGDIDDILENYILGKAHITYLGDWLPNGKAEQGVYDFITTTQPPPSTPPPIYTDTYIGIPPNTTLTGVQAENIVFDPVTNKYWWVFQVHDTQKLMMASSDTIEGGWTLDATFNNLNLDGGSPDLKLFNGRWYLYYWTWASLNIRVRSSTNVNSGYGNETQLLPRGSAGSWEAYRVMEPYMYYNPRNSTYYLFYMGADSNETHFLEKTGYATSSFPDKDFVKYEGNPVLSGDTSIYDTGDDKAADAFVFEKVPFDGFYYVGVTSCKVGKGNWTVSLFKTSDFITFELAYPLPILSPTPGTFDARASYRGAMLFDNGKYYLSYDAIDGNGVHRLGIKIINFDIL